MQLVTNKKLQINKKLQTNKKLQATNHYYNSIALVWFTNYTGQQEKKFFFCYVTKEIVILVNLGALTLKIQLVFSITSRF